MLFFLAYDGRCGVELDSDKTNGKRVRSSKTQTVLEGFWSGRLDHVEPINLRKAALRTRLVPTTEQRHERGYSSDTRILKKHFAVCSVLQNITKLRWCICTRRQNGLHRTELPYFAVLLQSDDSLQKSIATLIAIKLLAVIV